MSAHAVSTAAAGGLRSELESLTAEAAVLASAHGFTAEEAADVAAAVAELEVASMTAPAPAAADRMGDNRAAAAPEVGLIAGEAAMPVPSSAAAKGAEEEPEAFTAAGGLSSVDTEELLEEAVEAPEQDDADQHMLLPLAAAEESGGSMADAAKHIEKEADAAETAALDELVGGLSLSN